jgi:hypothetical protein
LDIDKIIGELEQERDRIERAIASLKGSGISASAQKAAPRNKRSAPHRGSGMSRAARKRLSLLMKKRWAERRKKTAKTS